MGYALDFQAAKMASIGMGFDVPNWPELPDLIFANPDKKASLQYIIEFAVHHNEPSR